MGIFRESESYQRMSKGITDEYSYMIANNLKAIQSKNKLCALLLFDVAEIFSISIGKALSLLVENKVHPSPKQREYDVLEIDEFWSFVGPKENKVWLIYAYRRESGKIVVWTFGKRKLFAAKKLRCKIKELGVSFAHEKLVFF